MAPKKKQKGRTFGVPSTYDRRRFTSAEAEARYTTNVIKRSLIPERGLGDGQGSISFRIEDFQWDEFCKQPDAAVIPIVREFYANVPEHGDYHVFVRGKWVSFSRTTINHVYKLQNIDDDYSRFLEGEINTDEIIHFLTNGRGQWNITSKYVTNFKTNHMNYRSIAWHKFICAKLIPTGHISDVTKDRAILNYCIQNAMIVDVGNTIQSSILKSAGPGRIGYGHPSLIAHLCKVAGVVSESTEELHHPTTIIDRKYVNKMACNARRRQKVVGTSSSHPPPPVQTSVNPPTHVSSSSQPPSQQQGFSHHPPEGSFNLSQMQAQLTQMTQSFNSHFAAVEFHLNNIEHRIHRQVDIERRRSEWSNQQAAFHHHHQSMNHDHMLRAIAAHFGDDVS